jgi:hypothetical protein
VGVQVSGPGEVLKKPSASICTSARVHTHTGTHARTYAHARVCMHHGEWKRVAVRKIARSRLCACLHACACVGFCLHRVSESQHGAGARARLSALVPEPLLLVIHFRSSTVPWQRITPKLGFESRRPATAFCRPHVLMSFQTKRHVGDTDAASRPMATC